MTAPGDLVGLADCKAWLGLASTADDAVIAGLITAVSQAISSDLGRTVQPATVTDVLDGTGAASVLLRQWPATRVISCIVDGCPLAATSAGGVPGVVLDLADPAPPGRAQRLTRRGGLFANGIGNVAITYRAGYEILGEAATVPTMAPLTVAAAAPYGAWASDSGVTGARGSYGVVAGTYTFTAVDAGATLQLAYGYVPADLARATIEWVADRYAARARIGQSAKTLGGQETASFIVKAMPDFVGPPSATLQTHSGLSRWKRISPAPSRARFVPRRRLCTRNS